MGMDLELVRQTVKHSFGHGHAAPEVPVDVSKQKQLPQQRNNRAWLSAWHMLKSAARLVVLLRRRQGKVACGSSPLQQFSPTLSVPLSSEAGSVSLAFQSSVPPLLPPWWCMFMTLNCSCANVPDNPGWARAATGVSPAWGCV